MFTDLFYEDIKAKENELALYNALFGTNYTLEQVTIEKIKVDDVVYMKLKNDVSFNINNRVIVFSEHQSTLNGNMPLRNLLYVARAYEKMIPAKERYKIGTVKIPRPAFFVFYNGEAKTETEFEQKLSQAYLDNEDDTCVSLELTVKVININTQAGSELLERCKVLKEYSQFVEVVRNYRREGADDYMKKAITFCIRNHILEEYLSRKGSEVMNFLCAEYDYEMDMQVKGEEAFEQGLEQGMRRGVEQGIERGVEAFILDNLEEDKDEKTIINKLTLRFALPKKRAKELFDKYSE